MDVPLQLAANFGFLIVSILASKAFQYFFTDLPKKRRRQELLDTLRNAKNRPDQDEC
jgi:hypothetical protein